MDEVLGGEVVRFPLAEAFVRGTFPFGRAIGSDGRREDYARYLLLERLCAVLRETLRQRRDHGVFSGPYLFLWSGLKIVRTEADDGGTEG